MNSCNALSNAIYTMGRISANPPMCQSVVLKNVADTIVQGLGCDSVALIVFEKGIEHPASAAVVAGAWSSELAERLLHATRWDLRERVLGAALAQRERNQLFRRSDLVDDKAFVGTRLNTDVVEPLGVGDLVVGLYHRSDGAELMISIQNQADHGAVTGEMLKGAEQLARFAAGCWASTWHSEPEWMKSLKSQSRRVLDDVLEGFDDDQIAIRTGLTYHSVRAHLKRLFRDANVRSRLHLMQLCRSERFAGHDIAEHLPPVAVVHTTVRSITSVNGNGTNGHARKMTMSAAG